MRRFLNDPVLVVVAAVAAAIPLIIKITTIIVILWVLCSFVVQPTWETEAEEELLEYKFWVKARPYLTKRKKPPFKRIR